jgi:hypothetical protein
VRLLRQDQAGDEIRQDPQALGNRWPYDDERRSARRVRRFWADGMSELIIYLDQSTGLPGHVRSHHPPACPAYEAWVPLSRCTCHLRLAVPCGFCGEPYHSRCTYCHRAGVPYTYHGIEFDGLCAYRGDRLCPACRDARMETEGVDILVVDDRPSVPPYVINTVRDRDTVFIRMPPELRGVDGRDLYRRRRK